MEEFKSVTLSAESVGLEAESLLALTLRSLCSLDANPYLDKNVLKPLTKPVYFSDTAEHVAAAAAQEYKLPKNLQKVAVPKSVGVEIKNHSGDEVPGTSKGVYATKQFKLGECLGVYTGLCIDSLTYSLLFKSQQNPRFIAEVVPGLYVDGRFGGPFAETNHSDRPNANLCIMKAKGKPGHLQIGVFAKMPIATGKQITLHYNGPNTDTYKGPNMNFKVSFETEHHRIFDGQGKLENVIACEGGVGIDSLLQFCDFGKLRDYLDLCKAAKSSEVMDLLYLTNSGQLQEGVLLKQSFITHRELNHPDLFKVDFAYDKRLCTLVQIHEMAFGGLLPEINLYSADESTRLFKNPEHRESSSVKMAKLSHALLKTLLLYVKLEVGGLEPSNSYGVVNEMGLEFFSSFQSEGKGVSTLLICNFDFHVCIPSRSGKQLLSDRGWRLEDLESTWRVPFQLSTDGTSIGTVYPVKEKHSVLIPAGAHYSYILPCK
jgi:hypothetical protein